MEIHNQLIFWDYLVIVLYLVLLIGVGFFVSYRKKSSNDLFLAGRTLKWYNIGLSMWGTNVSPSMLIASAGLAYTTGVVGGNFSWLAFPLLFLLGMLFVPHYLNSRISTLPEFMSLRFNERTRDLLSWYAMITILVSWLGSNLYVGGLLLSQIMNWPLWLSLLALLSIASSFTVAGGLKAVVITDAFQMILLILASATLVILGLIKAGGPQQLINDVPEDYWQLFKPASDELYPWYALLLGYPVIGLWFWCSDQTIVQRVLGAKNMEHAQLGANFTGWLKILDTFIFILPGIIAFALWPNLEDPDKTYMTMVVNLLPSGMVGLIVAVLIAAIVSTIDSGLNSLSTVFTLDIYKKRLNRVAKPGEIKRTGRIVTFLAAVLAFFLSFAMSRVKGIDLFSLMQAIISFVAPPMASIFLLGVTWKRATATAANVTLITGAVLCVVVGVSFLFRWPSEAFWPHFLLLSFYIFLGLSLLMVTISLLTAPDPAQKSLSSITDLYRQQNFNKKKIWMAWGLLLLVMIILYLAFN